MVLQRRRMYLGHIATCYAMRKSARLARCTRLYSTVTCGRAHANAHGFIGMPYAPSRDTASRLRSNFPVSRSLCILKSGAGRNAKTESLLPVYRSAVVAGPGTNASRSLDTPIRGVTVDKGGRFLWRQREQRDGGRAFRVKTHLQRFIARVIIPRSLTSYS